MDGYKNKQMMKKFIVFIGLLACVLAGCTREKKEFTVLLTSSMRTPKLIRE